MITIDQADIDFLKKTIKTRLEQRFDYLYPELRIFLKNHSILTGGAISSIFHGETPKDYDLYLDDDFAIMSFKQYLNNDVSIHEQVKDISPKYMVDTEVDGKLITSNAVTLKNDLQVITMATKQFRETFDYIHCMPWYDIKNDTLYMSHVQYQSIKTKKLVLNPKGNKPTPYRTQKYKERGWK